MKHSNEEQQSTTFIEWCDNADDWSVNAIIEENGNTTTTKSQANEICPTASAELENSDADDSVVVEPIVLPNIDVLQLLDSRKEIPLVSQSVYIVINSIFKYS